GNRRALQPTYNRAGAIISLDLDATWYVTSVGHDARGKSVLVAYGNGLMTRIAYDPRTFRMTRLRSEAYTQSDATGLMPVGPAMQDWTYVHDLVGNPLSIEDRALDRSGCVPRPQSRTARGHHRHPIAPLRRCN